MALALTVVKFSLFSVILTYLPSCQVLKQKRGASKESAAALDDKLLIHR